MKFATIYFLFLLLPSAVNAYAFVPSKWGTLVYNAPTPSRASVLVMKETAKEPFSLGTLFGKKTTNGDATNAKGLRGTLEAHPSVRPHISPLNRLARDKANLPTDTDPLPAHPEVRSGVLENGMPYIILPNKSPPGRFEAHLQVFSGSGKCFKYFPKL
jgi:hypothetical protein